MGRHSRPRMNLRSVATVAVLALLGGAWQVRAQAPAQNASQAQPGAADAPHATQPRESDRRHAAQLYLDASKLFLDQHFEEAMQNYEQATKLDPSNVNYRLALEIARSHAVTA